MEHDILADLGRCRNDVPFAVEITVVFGVFEQHHSRHRSVVIERRVVL